MNIEIIDCEYCMGDVDNRKALLVDNFLDEVYISGNNELVGNDGFNFQEDIKLNYCPMCGRKL